MIIHLIAKLIIIKWGRDPSIVAEYSTTLVVKYIENKIV